MINGIWTVTWIGVLSLDLYILLVTYVRKALRMRVCDWWWVVYNVMVYRAVNFYLTQRCNISKLPHNSIGIFHNLITCWVSIRVRVIIWIIVRVKGRVRWSEKYVFWVMEPLIVLYCIVLTTLHGSKTSIKTAAQFFPFKHVLSIEVGRSTSGSFAMRILSYWINKIFWISLWHNCFTKQYKFRSFIVF